MKIVQYSLFFDDLEKEAINRIKKFEKIADSMNLEIAVGFSGGKDSQVVYDLCLRAGIKFKAYFNHSFESGVTQNFIRENYPAVIKRRDHKFGFIENIYKNHGGLLPTVQIAYCCKDYKHNPSYVDACSITGVRKAESNSRKSRTSLVFKNETLKKKTDVSEYFLEQCKSVGTASLIQLLPIVDWSENDVWEYLYRHELPINPEYQKTNRIGCIVCPKANFNSNAQALIEHPKLIDAFIKARERGSRATDWLITSDGIDYENDKCYYICRWLNHSFMPFSKRNEILYKLVRERYEELKKDDILC